MLYQREGKKFTALSPQKYPNKTTKKNAILLMYRDKKKLPLRVPLMITRMLKKRSIRTRLAMEVRFNSQILFTLK